MDEAMSKRDGGSPETGNGPVLLSWEISPRGVSGRARDNARVLRRYQTPAEALLWDALRGRKIKGLKFRRQVPVGRFIVDSLCFEAGLVIEADGFQHSDIHVHEYDDVRTNYLKAQGLEVLRLTNHEIETNLPAVIDRIVATAHRLPSPQRERGRG
jgi:very-short-patch-repair endonuclease